MLLHDDIARQHGADLGLELEGVVRQLRVASPEDSVGTKVLAQLRLQRGAHVDVRKHPEALALQHLTDPRNRLIERAV
jgi:hypothetical protein